VFPVLINLKPAFEPPAPITKFSPVVEAIAVSPRTLLLLYPPVLTYGENCTPSLDALIKRAEIASVDLVPEVTSKG